MGVRSWPLVLFSLCLFCNSGLSIATTFREEEHQEISYEFGTKLDAVPVVNPTTPGTANSFPTLNPTTTPQAPGSTGQTTPTTPYMTPINPYTNPTTPKTSPTNPYSNPTTPTMAPPSPTTTTTTPTTPTTPTTTASSGGQWCIASQSAAENTLKVALDYACGYGADCSAIQPGASCYNPNTLKDHASYAFNDYYQKNPAPTSCVFGGTASLTSNDPSSGSCKYASPKSTSTNQPPPTPTFVSPPSPPTPVMTPTPPDMLNPGGGSTVFGSEPTGSPNTATFAFNSLLMLFTCGLLASLQLANYI